MVLDLFANGILLAANSCTGLCYDITSPYVFGAALAAVGVILVIFVLAVLYMMSPALGTTQLRAWIKTKVYDEFASIVFIFIFLAFGALVATLPVYSSLSYAGLVSSECSQVIQNPPPPQIGQSTNYDNLYFVSLCDVYQFNQDVSQFSTTTFYVATLVSLLPQNVEWQIPSQEPAVSLPLLSGSVPPEDEDTADSPGAISTGGFYDMNIGLVIHFTLMPIQPIFHYFVPLLNTLYVLFILSQVQLFLISTSGLIYATLMAVGLVARSFGITRTFGGAMIAFALGIGVVYPLMTAVSYGFLTSTLDVARNNFACAFSLGGTALGANTCTNGSGMISTVKTIVETWIKGTLQLLLGSSGSGASQVGGTVLTQDLWIPLAPILRAYLIFGGIIAIGLTFVPLLNLTVVDVFIIDFSLAIGERMDFLSLLTRLV